jgi:hypothetical protein
MSLLQSLSLLSSVCTDLLAFILQRRLVIIIKQVEEVSGSWNPTKGAVGVEVDRRSVVVHRVLRLSKSGVAHCGNTDESLSADSNVSVNGFCTRKTYCH